MIEEGTTELKQKLFQFETSFNNKINTFNDHHQFTVLSPFTNSNKQTQQTCNVPTPSTKAFEPKQPTRAFPTSYTNTQATPQHPNNTTTTPATLRTSIYQQHTVPTTATIKKDSEFQPRTVSTTTTEVTHHKHSDDPVPLPSKVTTSQQACTVPTTSTTAKTSPQQPRNDPPQSTNTKEPEHQVEKKKLKEENQSSTQDTEVVATNHEEGKMATYAQVTMNGEKVVALIDTGACVTIASEEFAKKCLGELERIENKKCWKAANGGDIEVLGQTTAKLKISEKEFCVPLIVAENKFIIDFEKNSITVGNQETPLIKEKSSHRRIVFATKSVEVEPFAEKTIWSKEPNKGVPYLKEKSGRYSIVSSCVEADDSNRIPVTVVNLSNNV